MENNIIGRIVKISIPELGIDNVKSKVDTGAWSNVIHVDNIKLKNDILKIKINGNKFSFINFRIIKVKNSFGKKHKRFSIPVKILIDDKVYRTHISLNDRSKMKYPSLLGCRFLVKNKFVIDPNKK